MRTKHTFRLPPDLAGKLADYAARKRVPQALVVEAALASHLSPDGDWAGAVVAPAASDTEDPANAGIRREPELPEHEEIVAVPPKPVHEFEPADEEPDDEVQRQRIMQRSFGTVARQVSLDPDDDMQM